MAPRRICALVAILGVLLLRAPSARADEPVALVWAAPPACREAAFTEPLRRYVGARGHVGPPLRVEIHVRERGPGRWELDLDIASDAARGTRELSAESCATLAEAAAFIVAQALAHSEADALAPPDLVPEAPPPALPPDEPPVAPPAGPPAVVPPPVTPPAEPAPPAPVEPEAPPPRTRRLQAAVRVAGGVHGGVLPGVSPGLALTLGLLAPRWRVDLIGRGDLPTLARSAADPSVGARIGVWAIGARGCAVPRRARLEFPLCLGAELGQAIGRSDGARDDGRAALAWAAATISPGLAWSPLPWLALVVQADLVVPLVRHDFLISGLPPLYRLGPVGGGGSLGVEWRFPGPRAR